MSVPAEVAQAIFEEVTERVTYDRGSDRFFYDRFPVRDYWVPLIHKWLDSGQLGMERSRRGRVGLYPRLSR